MVNDLLGGQIDVAFLPLAGNVPAMIKEGRIKAYGVTAREPHPPFPGIPAMASGRLDRMVFDLWAGIFVSKRVPDAAVERLNSALVQTMRNPEVREVLESTGHTIFQEMSPVALDSFYSAEIARYQAIAKSANVQAQ